VRYVEQLFFLIMSFMG